MGEGGGDAPFGGRVVRGGDGAGGGMPDDRSPRGPRERTGRPVKRQVSAGGVVYRVHEGRVEFALVCPTGRSVWCLPKGMVEAHEKPEEAALREVQEETGLVARPKGSLGEIEYWFAERAQGIRIHKRVHHFLFEAMGGSLADHDHEIGEARWFDAAQAQRSLAYANERTILDRAIQATASLNIDDK